MSILKQTCRAAAAAALVAAAALAQAVPVVSISPPSQTVPQGPVSVDIVVSGLTEGVGGFSLTLTFDDNILVGIDFPFGPGMGPAPLDLSFGFTGGSLDLFVAADLAIAPGDLFALQGSGNPWTLATVNFDAVADGFSGLALSNVVLSNADGSATIPDVTSRNGSVCVGTAACNPVPEPAGALLTATALLAAFGLRRRWMS